MIMDIANNTFNRNITALKKRDVILGQYFEKLTEERLDIVNVRNARARDGGLVVQVFVGNVWISLGSSYSFKAELDRFSNRHASINDYATVLLFGFGNGRMIERWIESMPPHIKYIIYEPDKNIFINALINYNLVHIIENNRIEFVVEGINSDQLDSYVRGFVDETNYKISAVVDLPVYKRLYGELYNKAEMVYNSAIRNCESDILSDAYMNREATEFCIKNLRFIFDCNCAEQFCGCFPEDLPVVIIGAGPSLENNGYLLRELKGKLLLIAVDTALPYLMSIGVEPDIAVSVSPSKDTTFKELYKDTRFKNITFAIDTIVTHTGLSQVVPDGKRLIYASNAAPYYNELFAITKHSIAQLDNGGSVSTVALSLAYLWGYTKFVLVGLDMAISCDKQYAGRIGDNLDLPGNMFPVKGYYGGVVYTEPDYNLHHEWFEMMIRTHPKCEFYNATEGGIMIQGAVNIPLETIVRQYDNEKHDYVNIFDNMNPVFDKEDYQKIYSRFVNSLSNLDQLKEQLHGGIRAIDESVILMRNGASIKNVYVQGLYTDICSVLDYCNELSESYFVERMITDKDEDILTDMYCVQGDSGNEYARMLEKLYKYFNDMVNAVDDVKVLFEELIYGINQEGNNK